MAKKQLSISYICDTFYPVVGGVAEVSNQIAFRFKKKGYDVHVYTPDWDHEKRIKQKEEIVQKVPVTRIHHWFRVGNFGVIWPQIFFILLRSDSDIIHAHVAGHLHTFLAALAARIKRKKFFVTTHSPWGDEGKRSLAGRIARNISYNFFLPFVFKSAKKIFILTEYEEFYVKKYGGKSSQINIIPNGIDDKYFHFDANDIRKELGYNEYDKLILFVGRLDENKNPVEFVKIGKLLTKNYPKRKYKFLIAGPDRGEREDILKEIGYYTNFRLLGTVTGQRLVDLYSSSDLLLMTSLREAFGLVAVEAFSQGLPVVAPKTGGLTYLIHDGHNGFLYKSGNIEDGAEKVHSIISNNILKNEISIRNKKASRRYKWDKLIDKIEEAYLG